jgi:hypothetical protein
MNTLVLKYSPANWNGTIFSCRKFPAAQPHKKRKSIKIFKIFIGYTPACVRLSRRTRIFAYRNKSA